MMHDHNHAPPTTPSTAFTIALLFNLGFALAEGFFGFLAHSMSLFADMIHNLGDVLSLGIAWFTTVLSKKAAPGKYSYGYKKTTLLSALTNALILVFTSAIVFYESIRKLLVPVPINELLVIAVAFIGILINGGTSLLFAKDSHSDLNIKTVFLHLAYDALLAMGIVVSGTIIYFTGWVRIDPILALGLVVLILIGTWNLLRTSIELILGVIPQNIDKQAVYDYLSKISGVTAIHDLHIWSLSTQENALTAHLIMPNHTLSDEDHHEINHTLKHRFNIHHITLQTEQGTSKDPCGQALTC